MAVGQSGTPPKVGVVGTGAVGATPNIIVVGQNEIPVPKVGAVGTGAVKVGATVAVGNVGVKVGAKVGTVGTISGVVQSETPPKVGVVGTGAVKVGTVGVNVVVGNVPVGNGVVGAAPNIIAVGQSEIPPTVGVVGTGAVKGLKVGSIRAVAPGAIPGTGAVVTVETGGKITAKLIDEIKRKTVIINKLMKNNRSDFIQKSLLNPLKCFKN